MKVAFYAKQKVGCKSQADVFAGGFSLVFSVSSAGFFLGAFCISFLLVCMNQCCVPLRDGFVEGFTGFVIFSGIFILVDSSITCLAEGFEGDSDLEVFPVSLCPLPLACPAWEGSFVLEHLGPFRL